MRHMEKMFIQLRMENRHEFIILSTDNMIYFTSTNSYDCNLESQNLILKCLTSSRPTRCHVENLFDGPSMRTGNTYIHVQQKPYG